MDVLHIQMRIDGSVVRRPQAREIEHTHGRTSTLMIVCRCVTWLATSQKSSKSSHTIMAKAAKFTPLDKRGESYFISMHLPSLVLAVFYKDRSNGRDTYRPCSACEGREVVLERWHTEHHQQSSRRKLAVRQCEASSSICSHAHEQSPAILDTHQFPEDMPVFKSTSDRLPLVDADVPFDDIDQLDNPPILVPFSSLWTVMNASVPVDINPLIDIDPSFFNIQSLNDRKELALDDDEDIFGEFNLEENPHNPLSVDVAGNVLCSSFYPHNCLPCIYRHPVYSSSFTIKAQSLS